MITAVIICVGGIIVFGYFTFLLFKKLQSETSAFGKVVLAMLLLVTGLTTLFFSYCGVISVR